MPLQIEIKPRERIIVGPYVIASTEKTKLTFFSDDVIILREKDYMPPTAVRTRCEKLYLDIQTLYLSPERRTPAAMADTFSGLAEALPGLRIPIQAIEKLVAGQDWFRALKETRKLIEYEAMVDPK
jgi:flagellar biosynthesis repressor protein FlbT